MSDIDDLLIEAKRVCGERWQKAPEYPWEVAARFGAEVGRLRVALQEIEVCSTCRMTVGFTKNINAGAEPTWFAERAKLEAENAELRGLVDAAKIYLQQNSDEILALRAENAELKKRLTSTEIYEVPTNCPDCNNATAGFDVIEGAPHCRYCGDYLGSEP